jgi:hypothetical protein
LASRFPDLPAPVVAVLALYSFGMLLAHACGLATVVLFLAKHLGWPALALRKRLREFYLPAQAKSGVKQGQKRKDFDVTTCFSPLLRWILSLWSGKHLPLAIDVTNLADRFHVLCVSVVVRGVALPVAWKVLLGGVKEPWNPHWQTLLAKLQPAVPADWTVLVLSDRGLESPALFRFLVGLHWHPLMRVKKGGKFRPKGWHQGYLVGTLLRQAGTSFQAEGWAYAGQRLRCTLLARWDASYREPWLLLTDLPPEAASAVWYALRSWIEQGFKILKGGCWDWQKTRMEDPDRVERLWLVLAVATLWVVALGAADEVQQEIADQQQRLASEWRYTHEQARARQAQEQQRLQKQQQAQQARRERQQARKPAARRAAAAPKAAARPSAPETARGKKRAQRVSARGLAEWVARWQRGEHPLPEHLHPEPWPQPMHSASNLTEQEFLSQPT